MNSNSENDPLSSSNGSIGALKAGSNGTKTKRLCNILKSSTLYCEFCDVFTSPSVVRCKDAQGETCSYYTCRKCYEIIAPVPQPRLVGIELNPGPGRKGGRRIKKNFNRRREMAQDHVTEYQSSPIQNRKLRFQAQSAFSGDISTNVIANLFGLSTTANDLVSIYNSFKLNRVQIWSSGANGDLKLDPISLKYISNDAANAGTNKVHSDYGNANRLAYLSVKPYITDLANFWNRNNNLAIFNISVNEGDIIDLDLSVIFDSNEVASGFTTSSSMIFPGRGYYLYLDADQTTPVLKPSINQSIF